MIKSLIALSVPIIFANILQTAYQLTDTFWVGRLGAGAVAAVSVTFPIIFLLISLGGGLTVAGSILIAQYAGAKNARMVNHVSAQTLLMVFTASIALSIIGYMISPSIMRLMGVPDEIIFDATKYLQISFLGSAFTFIYMMFQSIMRGIGEVRLPLYVVLSTVLLNLILDPLFIFGAGPIPATGVAGAAYATILTQGLSALIAIIIFFDGRYGIHLKLKDFRPNWRLMKQTFLLGLPASVEQSARAFGITAMIVLVSTFHTFIIAVYGIGTRIFSFVIIPALGLSMATSTLVGQNIGAGNSARATKIARFSAWAGFLFLTAIGALTFTFAAPLVRFFIPNDPAVVAEGASFVRIMSFMFGFVGIQQALTGAFRGAGSTFMTMTITIVSLWVFQFPLAYILSKHTTLGAQGLWWAFPIANITSTLITILWFVYGKWQKEKLTGEAKVSEKVLEEAIVEEGPQE